MACRAVCFLGLRGPQRQVAASPFPPCLLAFPGGLSLIAAYCGRLTGNVLQTQPSCR